MKKKRRKQWHREHTWLSLDTDGLFPFSLFSYHSPQLRQQHNDGPLKPPTCKFPVPQLCSFTRKSIKPRHRLCPMGLWIAQHSFHSHSLASHGLSHCSQGYGKYRVRCYMRSAEGGELDATVRHSITAPSLLLNYKSLRGRTLSSCCSAPTI